MGRMSDMNQISPQFVMSALFEEDFKPFLDEVCRKTVINGDQPSMEVSQDEAANRAKLVSLFRRFHFGDEMSAFEHAVEVNYLEKKYDKYERLLATGVPFAHQNKRLFSCIILESDVRRLNGIRNYIMRNVEYFDDFKQVYEVALSHQKMDVEQKARFEREIFKLEDINWFSEAAMWSAFNEKFGE